jgi:hypothetical protein
MALFNSFAKPRFGRADAQRRKFRRSTSGIAFALTSKFEVSGFLIETLNLLTDNVFHPRCLRSMSILPHPFDTTIRSRRILGRSSRVAHLGSRQLRMGRLEGEIVDSIAMVQRRRLTRTDMLTLLLSPLRMPPTCEYIKYFTWNLRRIDIVRCVQRNLGTRPRIGEMVCTWFVLSPSLLTHVQQGAA